MIKKQPIQNQLRHKALLLQIKQLSIFILLPVFILATGGGCSFFQNNTGYDLEKQIERQQIHQEMASELAVQEEKSAAEYADLGDRFLLQGDINRAYIYYMKGLGEDPNNVSILHKQGALLLKKNKYSEAEATYEKLLAIDSNDWLALEGRGKVYFGLSKFSEAEKIFLNVLSVKPDQWQSHEYLGLIYSRKKNYTQAINRFKTALAYQPRNTRVSNNLAVTYYINGNFDEAVRLYQLLLKTSNNQKIYNNLALAYFQLGLYDEALDSFRNGTDTEAVAYNNMGYEHLTHRNYKEAVQAFEKAIELYPKFYPSAQKNLNIAQKGMSVSMTE